MSLNWSPKLYGVSTPSEFLASSLTPANAQTAIPTVPPLPSRSDFVIRGAYVLTMDRRSANCRKAMSMFATA